MTAPGRQSGHPDGVEGLSWRAYLDALVAERGSLAAVAEHVAAQRGYREEVATVERGLRRLRSRGHAAGGVWGRRVLATFGMPGAIDRRLRWMGHYHSRFTDLPTSVCFELLRPWDRPPVSASTARVWVQLGLANVALRRRERARSAEHLEQAARAGSPDPAARVELALVDAYRIARAHPEASRARLDEAEQLLCDHEIDGDHHLCLRARLVDQRAYPLNKPTHHRPDHEAALALYETIPDDGPPFARCRRHNGLGWSHLKLGDRERAVTHARASVAQAGDAGSLRLRAMALNLLAHALEGDEARTAAARAHAIAARLEDDELLGRYPGEVAR